MPSLTPGVGFSSIDSGYAHQSHAEALFDALDANGDGVTTLHGSVSSPVSFCVCVVLGHLANRVELSTGAAEWQGEGGGL